MKYVLNTLIESYIPTAHILIVLNDFHVILQKCSINQTIPKLHILK